MENKLRELRGARSLERIEDEFRKRGNSSVKKGRISEWERGQVKPSLDNSLILMEIYNILGTDAIKRIKDVFGLE